MRPLRPSRAASCRAGLGAVLLSLSLGCAASPGSGARAGAPPPPARASPEQQAGAAFRCPVAMPGVRMSSEETPEGAAVRFTLRDGQRLAELRAGVREMVARQVAYTRAQPQGRSLTEAPAHQCPVCPGLPVRLAPPRGLGPGIGTGGAGVEGVHIPPARLEVRDTADGASVVYLPEEGTEREAVRDAVRRFVVQVRAGECPLPGGARG